MSDEDYFAAVRAKYGDAVREAMDGAVGFIYDGCHKLMILRTEADRRRAMDEMGWEESDIYPPDISDLWGKYEKSCFLRFISNIGPDWADYVPQVTGINEREE